MKKILLFLTAVLALSGCGGGEEETGTGSPPLPEIQRGIAFDCSVESARNFDNPNWSMEQCLSDNGYYG